MATTGYFHQAPRKLIDKLADVNWLLIAILCVLTAIGLASLYSVAGGSWSPWAERHALRSLIGLGVLIGAALVPLRIWYGLAYPSYAIALVALMLVPLIGSEALGARRWLPLGPLSFQPAELMKFAIVLALARYFQSLDPSRVSQPVWIAIPVFLIALPTLLIIRQPDLGTAVLLAIIGGGLMLLAGINLLYFLGAGAAAVALIPLVLANLHDYQRRRIETFLDPGRDPLGAGYHITQSKIALGSGGASGKGYLAGTQSQLDFLPEKHTDFIFTTLGEEWGFAGAIVVLGLFALLLIVLGGMALSAMSLFARLLIFGAALTIFGYATINVGMVTGALPVVGIPLPFISYGGTSLMTQMFALGLAMSAYVHRTDRFPRGGPLP